MEHIKKRTSGLLLMGVIFLATPTYVYAASDNKSATRLNIPKASTNATGDVYETRPDPTTGQFKMQ
jgi:hypothetical protein